MSKRLPYHPDSRGTERIEARSMAPTLGTWPTFGFMAAMWVALAFYTNEHVLTPQVLADLATQSGGMAMAPDQVNALQRLEWLSYGLLPVMLAGRVAFTALVLHLFAMLLSTEIGYRDLFRASLWGFSAVLYGMFVQTLRLDLLGPGLTIRELTVIPDSLAALFLDPAPSITMGYSALSLLSIHGLLWIVIIFTYLRFERRLTSGRALLVPLAGWATISVAQLGLQVFTIQILS